MWIPCYFDSVRDIKKHGINSFEYLIRFTFMYMKIVEFNRWKKGLRSSIRHLTICRCSLTLLERGGGENGPVSDGFKDFTNNCLCVLWLPIKWFQNGKVL